MTDYLVAKSELHALTEARRALAWVPIDHMLETIHIIKKLDGVIAARTRELQAMEKKL